MNTLVIYYSLFGNNESIATNIAQTNNYDILEFDPGSIFRVFQFFVRKKRLAKKARQINTEKYNDIIICGPIWAGKPAPAIIKLLENIDLKNKKVTCNFTYTQDYGETESEIEDLIVKNQGNFQGIILWNIRNETNTK